MAKKQSQRTIVGSPLTPTLLKEMSAVNKFPSTPEDFRPDGNWTNKYRIWTCHGYRESGNQDVGFVILKRTQESDKTFTLNIHQEVAQTDNLTNIIDGAIKCRNDKLASPVQWKLSSTFKESNGKDIAELSSINIGPGNKPIDGATGDWCLFEAVQRLAADKQSSVSFNLLEGMNLSKPGHRLSYRDIEPMKMNGESISLHCFVQLGNGILPYEYWLDTRHRLFVVTSMNKAYILDDRAEKAVM